MEGLTTISSEFGPRETMDRLEAALRARGVDVFARIDHASAAARVGLALRPTELLVFGAPQSGTALMQADQTMGIDLPLKALVWQDASDRTWLSYNEPLWIVSRHAPGAATQATATQMATMLAIVTKAAATRTP